MNGERSERYSFALFTIHRKVPKRDSSREAQTADPSDLVGQHFSFFLSGHRPMVLCRPHDEEPKKKKNKI